VFAVALALGSGVEIARGDVLGTAFTYQGQLKDEGVPANDEYDFIFRLFDDPVGGAQIGSDFPESDWPVSDGLFTVKLDFGTDVFTGDALWLEVSVRLTDVGGEYTDLSPRQPLNATPYALYALSGPGSAGFWAANGDDIYNTNTGRVGVGLTDPVFNLHVYDMVPSGTIRPPTTFGVQWRQAVLPTPPNEWFYFAVGGAGPMVGSGTRLIRESGTELHFQTQDEMYSGWPSTQLMLDADGKVGIGTTSPKKALHVTGDYYGKGHVYLYAYEGDGNSGTAYVQARDDSGTSSIGLRLRTQNGGSVQDAMMLTPTGDVGIGTTDPTAKLHVSTSSDQMAQFTQWGTDPGVSISLINGGSNYSALSVYSSSNNAPALSVTGTASVDVLEIYGADVAEKFPVSEEVKPGMVVAIDAENPGKLCLSRGAYNRRVAGVVSGAGDIPAGTILGNLPGCEDAPAIALSGRVWVHCDATTSAIEPGDLLTTSDTPGYAMAVTEHDRATGAILGKAMTALDKGETGMVLVLVNLQ